jgi:hypothetical protein
MPPRVETRRLRVRAGYVPIILGTRFVANPSASARTDFRTCSGLVLHISGYRVNRDLSRVVGHFEEAGIADDVWGYRN